MTLRTLILVSFLASLISFDMSSLSCASVPCSSL
ncbi:unnamed protein product [Arabidopsis halleri]